MIPRMIEDAELLAGYISAHNIALPAATLQELLAAKVNAGGYFGPT